MTDFDYAGAWLKAQVRAGETAIALRSNGHDWRSIASTLSMDVDTVRRAAALFLSADIASREANGEGAGLAQGKPAPDGSPEGERVTATAG